MSNVNIVSQNQAFEAITQELDNIIQTGIVWDNMVSLSGAAGTGKTYLTTKLVEKLAQKYHITITAPTHKALQVLRQNLLSEDITGSVDTKTLQSFLNIRLNTDFDKGTQTFEPIKSKQKDETKTDLLIVDESSMVSYDLYQYIVNAIEKERIKAVIFVGDENQLLPVDNHDNKIFTINKAYKLDKIIRQASGSYIINMATQARHIITSKQYKSLEDFFQNDSFRDKITFFETEEEFHDDFCTPESWANKDKVIASFTNNSVDHHNRIIRDRYWKEQNVENPEVLLQGDTVIFQQSNVINEKIVHQNSDIVKLSSASKCYQEKLGIEYWTCQDLSNRPFNVIDPKSVERFKIVLNKIAKEAKCEKNTELRTQKWKFFYQIKELFVDVKYVYASTIHKLQGSTYRSVYIDLRDIENMKNKDMMFRLLYVAITRASEEVKILLPNAVDSSLTRHHANVFNNIDNQLNMFGMNL